MHTSNDRQNNDHPLRHLTPAQFMALGGNAVVYVRQVSGAALGELLPDTDYQDQDQDEFHVVVGANGAPLMVADTEDAVIDWLETHNMGVATLH